MFIRRAKSGQKGQGMTEYIIIVALVAVGAIAVISLFGGRIKEVFNKSSAAMTGTQDETQGQRSTMSDFDSPPPASGE